MDQAKLLSSLSDSDKSTVIRHALPGIDSFLKEILSSANLSREAEHLRLQYLGILDHEGELDENSPHDTNDKGSEAVIAVAGKELFLSDDPNSKVNRLDAGEKAEFWNSGDASKVNISPNVHRKGTGEANESGISLHADPWLHSPVDTHIPSSPTSTQGDTVCSDISADFELVDWESDATNGNEEGYCTGDNMCVESSIQNFNICPNELGELYTGVLYIQEHPGWHKRWFTLNDHCMKCFRHRTEPKMLFEIPLKGARIISTDRKKSRVFPIVLSIPKIKESIMFAATEEHVRQEWKYVLNYVIRELGDGNSSGDMPGRAESKISLDSLLRGKSVYGHLDEEQKQSVCVNEEHEKPVVQGECSGLTLCAAEDGKEQNGALKVSESSEEPESAENCTSPDPEESLAQWQVNIEAEDEMMEPTFSATMEEDESFRELQECLPEILQGRKSRISSQKKDIKRVLSTGDLPGSAVCPSSSSWGSMLSTSSSECTTVSTSELHSITKVKRQSSLANSLSSKASRVKSRITGSFFKKGKKGEAEKVKQYTSKSTTFSGYLLRMKGSLWKSRWCVVKEHSLFCYKDFDVGAAELDLRLPGKCVEYVPENDSKKPFVFIISTEKENYHFAAENDAELEEWIMVLQDETKLAEQTVSPGTTAIPELEGETCTDSSRGRKLSPTSKKDKSVPSPPGKMSILTSIGYKFGKTKTKVPQSGEATNDVMKSSSPEEVESAVQPSEISDDNAAMVERPPLPQVGTNNLEVPNTYNMSGFLHQRVHSDTWLKCWVKLESHFLYIHDDKDRGDAVVIKFKLSNCVVLDCTVEDRSHVLEIRRSRSQPIYLQADSQEEYDQWKAAISESIIESPLPARRLRPLPAQSSLDDCQASPRLRLKTGGDSFEQEDVFKSDGQGEDARVDLPLNPSPRPSTAGDVSSVESEDGGTSLDTDKRSECDERPARLRSFSEGEQDEECTRSNKSETSLRRSLSNALSSLDVTSTKKRRNKTLSGIKVPPELLMNITHTSCLYLRNKKGLWSKRWAILQDDKLHLFKRADDISPCVCITVEGCEVRQTTRKKTKKFAFELSIPSEGAEYCLAADNQKELVTWMNLLQVKPRDKGNVSKARFPQETNRPKASPVEPKELQKSEVPQPKTSTVNAENTEEPGKDCASSRDDLRMSREAVAVSDKSDSSLQPSSEALQQSSTHEKPSSLDAVLRLLQDQQAVQQIGQLRFDKAKKVQNTWKRSAAAARETARETAKVQSSRPDSPDGDSEKCEPVRRKGSSASETRYRTGSASQKFEASTKQSCVDVTEKFEKLAEDEKLRALKKETLLKKRRNSLNLEKEVLERKIVKGQEKKSTMKRLLGKEETDNKEDLAPAEKRLGDVQHELDNVQRDIEQNRRQQTEVLENLNNLKTRTVRKFSFRSESKPAGSRAEEKRKAFHSSPSESVSSQGSVEDRTGRELDSLQTPDPSRKKSGVESLVALEQELMKISPIVRRAPDVRKKRVSLSSEGTASPDDESLKGSPTPEKKSDPRLTELVATSDSSMAGSSGGKSPVGEALLDSAQLRRKRFSASSHVSFHKLSVEIPTDDQSRQEEAGNTVKTNAETSSETNAKQKDHKTSLVNALSQIKAFEEFAAGSLTEKYGQPKVL